MDAHHPRPLLTRGATRFKHELQRWSGRYVLSFERWFADHFLTALGLLLVVLGINELWLYGSDLTAWDPMLISGAVTFFVGLRLALLLPDKLTETLDRLADREVLKVSPEQLDQFQKALASEARVWQARGGIVVAGAILAAFVVAYGRNVFALSGLVLLEALAGYIAGRQIGRAALHGRLGGLLHKHGITLEVEPGHLDGAAGLRPVGDLYFFQAMLLALPAAFLAIWWLLIPAFDRYAEWRTPYMALLVIVLAFENLAFIAPMRAFHQEMQRQKRTLVAQADQLSHRVQSLQQKLTDAESTDERNAFKEQLAHMTERYWEIERMPTWPVDARVRRRFTINNAALFLPILGQSIHLSGAWQATLHEISNILSQ